MSAAGKVVDAEAEAEVRQRDRSFAGVLWYELVRKVFGIGWMATGGLRASGRENLPRSGGAMLVSNHLSHLDVFVLGIPATRPLNYVARSTLFVPPLGAMIRSVGGFPIQRDGMGAQGLKETLRRLRNGGIVLLFPEGTRSSTGELAELKSGISVLAARARVPVIPAAVAGTFEAWPRSQLLPSPKPVRVHFGPPILPDEMARVDSAVITDLIRTRILECQREARTRLARDLGLDCSEN